MLEILFGIVFMVFIGSLIYSGLDAGSSKKHQARH